MCYAGSLIRKTTSHIALLTGSKFTICLVGGGGASQLKIATPTDVTFNTSLDLMRACARAVGPEIDDRPFHHYTLFVSKNHRFNCTR